LHGWMGMIDARRITIRENCESCVCVCSNWCAWVAVL
jgi:hypothetical protein